MGLFDTLRRELIDVVEWLDDTHHTLAWRFPRHQNEIKNGAQLIVRPGQTAVFVHQGQIADVFGPGRHTLETQNLPVLSELKAWKHGFNSPFKAEVYFVSTNQITGLKWGTPRPVMLRDPDFGPIRLRAFGTYTLRAMDPRALIRELVGTDGIFEVEEVAELLRSLLGGAVAEVLGQSNMSAMDLAANYGKLADGIKARVCEQIDDEYGLDIPTLAVVNVSFPPEVEEALDTRSSMGVIGDMNQFQQYQFGKAMLAGAQGGGATSDGLGLGMGLAMAQQVGAQRHMMAAAPAQHSLPPGVPPPGMPPPMPPPQMWHVGVNGSQMGPMGTPQLVNAIMQGQIPRDAIVWTNGMAAWTPAHQVPAIAQHLSTPPQLGAPPPMPGGGNS